MPIKELTKSDFIQLEHRGMKCTLLTGPETEYAQSPYTKTLAFPQC